MTTGNCSRLATIVLYNITVANAMAQRCKESAFVGNELRFFTMAFFLHLVFPTPLYIGTILFFEATKFDKGIRGADHPGHLWFDIRAALHILFDATILGLHPRPLLIDPGTFRAVNETA
jgi:hypothetical protein